jgi:hypothetical protein
MGGIESRLQRLEAAQHAGDAPQWAMLELRPTGDRLWRDDAGHTGTKEQHEARHDGPVIFVYLAD